MRIRIKGHATLFQHSPAPNRNGLLMRVPDELPGTRINFARIVN